MKSWNKIILWFSVIAGLISLCIAEYIKPDITLIKILAIGVGTFFISWGILSGLVLLLGNKDDENTSPDIKDGDIFYYYGDYFYGYSRVERVEVLDAASQQLRSTYAFANSEGEIVTKWYPMATEFIAPGVAAVAEEVKGILMWNFLNDKCEQMLTNWVYKIADNTSDDKIKVFWNDGTINFVDLKEGKFMWKDWKKSVG